MRRTNKCPWCKNEMKELEKNGEDRGFLTEYFTYCKICESRGPSYFYRDNKKVYKPSKNGVK